MLLPLGDAPNPRSTPYVTYAILLANVAIFLLITVPLSTTAPNPHDPVLHEYVETIVGTISDPALRRHVLASISAYDLFVFENGFRPAAPSFGTLILSLFLHAGFAHLFGNMLFLWIYGDNVEYRLGALPFLGVYIGSGIIATIFHSLFDLAAALPLIGASGAISGILGLYFLWFPHNRVRLLFFLPPFWLQSLYVPARIVLALYLVIDNVLPFVFDRGVGGGGVAYGAHIGGFLAGLGVAWFLDRRELRAKPEVYAGTVSDVATAIERVRQAVEGGRFEKAAELYFSLPAGATKRILPPADSLGFATWLRCAGHPHAALAVFRRHLRDYPGGPGLAEAHLGAGLVQLHDFDQPTPAYQHFLEALDSGPAPETAQEARRALAAIDAQRKRARFD